jgi:cytochrome P450 family 110
MSTAALPRAETNGRCASLALYELARHPQIADGLRGEIEDTGPELGTDAILAMPYLSAVCNEAVRLHPILAECARVPVEPIEILGITIPAGRRLVISIFGIHHDPATHAEPRTFRPERFLECSFSKTEFLPFGGGHRLCLGAGLAEYTMRIALAEGMTCWDFEPAREDFDVRQNIGMGPKYGVLLRILRSHQPRRSAGLEATLTTA